MKVFLMYRDRDFDLQPELPWNMEALVQDLELNILFNAMARERLSGIICAGSWSGLLNKRQWLWQNCCLSLHGTEFNRNGMMLLGTEKFSGCKR